MKSNVHSESTSKVWPSALDGTVALRRTRKQRMARHRYNDVTGAEEEKKAIKHRLAASKADTRKSKHRSRAAVNVDIAVVGRWAPTTNNDHARSIYLRLHHHRRLRHQQACILDTQLHLIHPPPLLLIHTLSHTFYSTPWVYFPNGPKSSSAPRPTPRPLRRHPLAKCNTARGVGTGMRIQLQQ